MRARAAVRIAAPVAVLAVTARVARRCRVGRTEERAFRLANEAPDSLRVPVWMVMQSGSLAAVFVVAAALRKRDREAATTALLAGTAVWTAIKVIKPVIGRGRPADHLSAVVVRGAHQSGLGFPSGHSAVATVLALVATPPGTSLRYVAVGTAAATGVARMYIGAHLPLDVVAGWSIGVLASEIAQSAGHPRASRSTATDH